MFNSRLERDFSLCVWCFIKIKGIIHPKSIFFFFIPSFTHLKVVLNLNEFHKRYFEEGGKLNSCWSTVTYCTYTVYSPPPPPPPTVKVNVDQQLIQILQNILFSVQHKEEINTGLGQHVSK